VKILINVAILMLLSLTTMGCWNGENVAIRLGDVSLGQQLIDLKAALDGGAMTQEEYAAVKTQLMDLTNLCAHDDDKDENEN
jgi:hypothetical protein